MFANIPDSGAEVELGQGFRTHMGMARFPVGITIAAIRMTFVMRHTSASTSASTGLTIGIGVFDEDSAPQVPRPITDQHANWMFWSQYYTGLAAGSGYAAQGSDAEFAKAQRKMEEVDDRLWLVVHPNASPADAGNTYSLAISTSVLLLLP